MLENPYRCYDPGYAAGATLRRAGAVHTDVICEHGLALRLESWATQHFKGKFADAPAYRAVAREHFRRGFRDGYWGRGSRREGAPFEFVA